MLSSNEEEHQSNSLRKREKGKSSGRRSIQAAGSVAARGTGPDLPHNLSNWRRGDGGSAARTTPDPLYPHSHLGNGPGLRGLPARLAGPGLVKQSAYAELAAPAANNSTAPEPAYKLAAAGQPLSRSLRN